MSGDGTESLRLNLISQQERLLQQLKDLDEERDNLDDDEYEENKAETLEQIIDVAASLEKLASGNMTLSDVTTSQRNVTRDAISKAFRTPEVIRMFALREPEQLQQRLQEKERDFKLGKLSQIIYRQEKKELLLALAQLGTKLSSEQENFLSEDQVDKGNDYERVKERPDNASTVYKWATENTAR